MSLAKLSRHIPRPRGIHDSVTVFFFFFLHGKKCEEKNRKKINEIKIYKNVVESIATKLFLNIGYPTIVSVG